MSLPKERIYTSHDYWNLPDGQRAELIDGKDYYDIPGDGKVRLVRKVIGKMEV